jgi:signal transduction histidine kinase
LNNNNNKKKSLPVSLFKAVFSIYVVITLIVTAIHIISEYFHQKKAVIKELEQLEYVMGPSLADSLFKFDFEQVRNILKGHIAINSLTGIKVTESITNTVIAIGKVELEGKIVQFNEKFEQQPYLAGLIEGRLISETFPVREKDFNSKIGHVEMYTDEAVIFERLKLGMIFIMTNAVIKTAVLFLLFIYVGHKLLSKPLKLLAEESARVKPDNLHAVDIRIKENNELKTVETAINRMIDNIKTALLKRKQAEAQVRKLNSNLESKVKQRTAELTHANQQLKESMEELQKTQKFIIEHEKMASLGELVAGVSHEINTPIGIGVTMASTIMDEAKRFKKLVESGEIRKSDLDDFTEILKESSQILLNSMNNAHHLIQNFKQVAVDQSSNKNREFNVKEVIEEVYSTLHHRTKTSSVSYELDVPDYLYMNSYPGPLGQILTNLFNNSLLHGFEEQQAGEIKVSVEDLGQQVKIIHEDNGSGIAETKIRRIFEPFYTTKLGQGGSGLGLSIVHNLVVHLLQGNIDVYSDKDNGTRFEIIVPKEVRVQELIHE